MARAYLRETPSYFVIFIRPSMMCWSLVLLRGMHLDTISKRGNFTIRYNTKFKIFFQSFPANILVFATRSILSIALIATNYISPIVYSPRSPINLSHFSQ